MMTKKKLLLALSAVILVSAVAYSAISVCFPSRRLALTEFNFQTPGALTMGLPIVEPTFENHVTVLASHVVVGTVLASPPEGWVHSRGIFEVQVQENLISRTAENTIKVSAENNLFEVGETYLMLLSRFACTSFPFDFYIADSQFVFRVDAVSDQVTRLKDPVERTFISPFQDLKYNSLSRLRQYIRSLAPANRIRYFHRDRDVQVLEEAPSHAALITMADHIWLIEAVSAELNANGTMAKVGFKR